MVAIWRWPHRGRARGVLASSRGGYRFLRRQPDEDRRRRLDSARHRRRHLCGDDDVARRDGCHASRLRSRGRERRRDFLRRLRERKVERSPGKAIFPDAAARIHPAADRRSRAADGIVAGRSDRVDGAFRRAAAACGPATHVRGERLGEGFWHLTVRFGFMEVPDLPRVLHQEKVGVSSRTSTTRSISASTTV